ncbi:hypothetical protein [Vibrio sp.]
MDAQAFTLNAPRHGVIPKGIIISKAALFQWIRKQCPRPERPHALLSNLKSKEAENRLATRDQAPLEGELTLIWQSASSCAQIRVIQLTRRAWSRLLNGFRGQAPKTKSTSGEVSL